MRAVAAEPVFTRTAARVKRLRAVQLRAEPTLGPEAAMAWVGLAERIRTVRAENLETTAEAARDCSGTVERDRGLRAEREGPTLPTLSGEDPRPQAEAMEVTAVMAEAEDPATKGAEEAGGTRAAAAEPAMLFPARLVEEEVPISTLPR